MVIPACGAGGVGTVCRASKRLDLRQKIGYAAQAREDVVAAREARREAALALRREDLVFGDESGVATSMARRYSRAPGERRVRASGPHGQWQRLTILGGLTLADPARHASHGVPRGRGRDRRARHARVRPTRARADAARRPHHRARQPLGHRDAEVRRLVEAAGCTLCFLPPYSPDLIPIEQAWSKLKGRLRSAGARTVDALHAALAQVVDAVTPRDAAGYFRHTGYAVH